MADEMVTDSCATCCKSQSTCIESGTRDHFDWGTRGSCTLDTYVSMTPMYAGIRSHDEVQPSARCATLRRYSFVATRSSKLAEMLHCSTFFNHILKTYTSIQWQQQRQIGQQTSRRRVRQSQAIHLALLISDFHLCRITAGFEQKSYITVPLPATTETTGPDGITVIVSWKLDEQDRRVKVG
jgi:hypothetical protein